MKTIMLAMVAIFILSCSITRESSSVRQDRESVPVVIYGDRVVPVPDAISLKDFLVLVPGVEVIQNEIYIRGRANPLVVIDGMLLSGGFPDALRSVNVYEIEQVEVIRNLDGTAQYGSRARNGVIIITTKLNAEPPL